MYFGRNVLWLQRQSSGRWTFLVEILSSCGGRGGCRWHFLAPCNLRHSPCGFLYNHLCLSANDTVTSSVILLVMAGDCGDEIPSKSKPQPAGVTSSANFVNLLVNRYLQTSSFHFYCTFREFRECSRNSSSVLFSFNLSTRYYSSLPVLTIFVATSFSS